MAKARFEQQQGGDAFTITAMRRAGERTIYKPRYEDLPGHPGAPRPQWAAEHAKGTTIPLSGPDRRLFEEDYSETEAARSTEAQGRFQGGLNDRLDSEIVRLGAAKGKDAADTKSKYEGLVGKFTPLDESREDTGDRLVRQGADLARKYRLADEGSMPGAGWYFDQNRKLRTGATSTDHDEKHSLITSSGSMSPLNSPEMESESAIEINRAHREHATVHVTKGAAGWLSKQFSGTKKNPEDPTPYLHTIGSVGKPSRPITDGPVDINDLHHDAVSMLARDVRRKKFKAVDTKSTVDFFKVAKGGTNVAKGVRGARGEGADTLSPPTSAPKVNNYTMNTRVHEAPADVEVDYRSRVDRSAALTSDSPLWGGPPRGVQEDRSLTLTPDIVDHLHRQLGAGTPQYDADDRAVRELKINAGRKVIVDKLHPRLVEALAHPGNANDNARHLALTSSNMPNTQDSWMNAAMMGQDSEAPGYKDSGSENLGYWKSMRRVGMRRITDVPNTEVNRRKEERGNTRAITVDAHQHAAQDKTVRVGSSRASERLGFVLPSVGVQESHAWTMPRRAADGDDPYRAAVRDGRGQQWNY